MIFLRKIIVTDGFMIHHHSIFTLKVGLIVALVSPEVVVMVVVVVIVIDSSEFMTC